MKELIKRNKIVLNRISQHFLESNIKEYDNIITFADKHILLLPDLQELINVILEYYDIPSSLEFMCYEGIMVHIMYHLRHGRGY